MKFYVDHSQRPFTENKLRSRLFLYAEAHNGDWYRAYLDKWPDLEFKLEYRASFSVNQMFDKYKKSQSLIEVRCPDANYPLTLDGDDVM